MLGWCFQMKPLFSFPPISCESKGKFLHCVGTACILCTQAGILTQVIRLVVTVLFPRNPFQKNEQSKNI